jgi:predicted dehydrogenase
MQAIKLPRLIVLFFIILFSAPSAPMYSQKSSEPLKVGIVGLTHDHVHWILGRPDRGDIKIVGIVEPNEELAKRHANHYGFSLDLVHDTMEELIAASKPEAVMAFGSIFEHLQVVETFAPLGIHIMVEKPLAVSVAHAQKMYALAKKHKVHLLTNYETTWYASNHKTYEMVENGAIGALRKIVVHDGHKGPFEIGISKEFLEWLTDPVLNGGGAVIDFGCYGVNLITWMKKGEKPLTVTAVTHTNKPEIYPEVDDEATIILQYPKMQGIVQASWNWPRSRKDMEVYGKTGYIFSDNSVDMRYRLKAKEPEQKKTLSERKVPYDDPFSFLAAVVKNKITLPDYALSSLENNMMVVEILEAAKKSAKTGKTIKL